MRQNQSKQEVHPTQILILLMTVMTIAVLPSAAAEQVPSMPSGPDRLAIEASAFYMFRSYEVGRDGFVTLIANYNPLQEPADASLPYPLDGQALYDLHVDSDGNGMEDLTFRFRFDRIGSFYTVELLRGPVEGPATADFLSRSENGTERFDVAFDGDVDIPGCGTGRVFVGQRQESYAFNRGLFRGPDGIRDPLGSRAEVVNWYAGTNTTSLAVEVPIECLTDGGDGIIGGWTTARLPRHRFPADHPAWQKLGFRIGETLQVSRFGNPWIGNAQIGTSANARFNASHPRYDAENFLDELTQPAIPTALAEVWNPTPILPPTNVLRPDLAAVYLTGLPGLNETGSTAEMLRLNTAIPPAPGKEQNNLGFLGGDPAGWPNGRRPGDDVIDVMLRVLEGALCHVEDLGLCYPEEALSGDLPLTDQTWVDATQFNEAFPYLLAPIPGTELSGRESPAEATATTVAKSSGCGCGSLPYICWYYAMYRAGYTQSCPSAISSSEFGSINETYMTSADIIEWSGHAAYITSSTSSTITVDDYNNEGSCSHRYGVTYSSWSNAVRGWVRKPARVSLKSPSNGAQYVELPVQLEWYSASRASKYWLQVATNSSFSNIVHEDENVSGTSKTLTLSGGTTYYWRVMGKRGPYGGDTYVYSKGSWSSQRSFTTISPCPSVGTPSISTADYQGHPKIYWSSVSGADKYKIYRRFHTMYGTYYRVADTTETYWVDWSVELFWGGPSKLYAHYKVKAVNDGPNCAPAYESGFSNYGMFACEDEVIYP